MGDEFEGEMGVLIVKTTGRTELYQTAAQRTRRARRQMFKRKERVRREKKETIGGEGGQGLTAEPAEIPRPQRGTWTPIWKDWSRRSL